MGITDLTSFMVNWKIPESHIVDIGCIFESWGSENMQKKPTIIKGISVPFQSLCYIYPAAIFMSSLLYGCDSMHALIG